MLQADLIQDLRTLVTAAGSRVHHQVIPQGTALPFIAISELSGLNPTTLDGRALFQRSTIRVAIFANSMSEAEPIKTQIRNRYRGFSGYLLTTRIHASRVESANDEVSFVDGDRLIKGTGLDIFFLYKDT